MVSAKICPGAAPKAVKVAQYGEVLALKPFGQSQHCAFINENNVFYVGCVVDAHHTQGENTKSMKFIEPHATDDLDVNDPKVPAVRVLPGGQSQHLKLFDYTKLLFFSAV
jgi:hypothetical protein